MELTLSQGGVMDQEVKKARGAYYTPDAVVAGILKWAVRSPEDELLDPSCGDGRFIAGQSRSVGVEADAVAAVTASRNAPRATIHVGDFFDWARNTSSRFDCVVGNPPFIRYQRFSGETRARALALCQSAGVQFSGLASSWAPFLVGSAMLLKAGGRMGFVVPAEIGHAPYARPLLSYLASHFSHVHVCAYREKLFSDLSEDAWILFASGYGGSTDQFHFSASERFRGACGSVRGAIRVTLDELHRWDFRLRPFVLPGAVREIYRSIADSVDALRFGDIARIGIGYVTGANDFFHLRPSQVEAAAIPHQFVVPAIRSGRWLSGSSVTTTMVAEWLRRDDPVLLLRLTQDDDLPHTVSDYLNSSAGKTARFTYKCRNRSPWYSVPDVIVPDAFMSYMCGKSPALVRNSAGCVCTNSVHAVRMLNGFSIAKLQRAWSENLTRLSCEVEGHALGGGMLKVEPREAARILIQHSRSLSASDLSQIDDGIDTMRRWRHYG